jgi:isopentenyl phosphate kinase
MRIGVIGNKEWQNKRKIQQVLTDLKQRFSNDLIVVGGGGSEGANFMIRKFALEFGIQYQRI